GAPLCTGLCTLLLKSTRCVSRLAMALWRTPPLHNLRPQISIGTVAHPRHSNESCMAGLCPAATPQQCSTIISTVYSFLDPKPLRTTAEHAKKAQGGCCRHTPSPYF